MRLEVVSHRWPGGRCIVAASGPSLTLDVANTCAASGWPVIVVNDAYRLLPWADVLYACDAKWWDAHHGAPIFRGEKWSSHSMAREGDLENDKRQAADAYGLHVVRGRNRPGFSRDPDAIHYGGNSGFQAINLAILFGAVRIVLVGFDMRGHEHFFGKHPKPLNQLDASTRGFERYVPHFIEAAHTLPEHIRILNCTPVSALTCFPMRDLNAIITEHAMAAVDA